MRVVRVSEELTPPGPKGTFLGSPCSPRQSALSTHQFQPLIATTFVKRNGLENSRHAKGRGVEKGEVRGKTWSEAGKNWSGIKGTATPGLELLVGLGRSWHADSWGPAISQSFQYGPIERPAAASQGLAVSWDRGRDGSRAALLLISGLLPTLSPVP